MLVESMEGQGLSPSTIRKYSRVMGYLCEYFDGKSPDLFEVSDILDYKRHLVVEKKLAPNSVNRYLSGIRYFYRHVLVREEFKGAFPDMKAPRKMPQILSGSEVKSMIEVVDNLLWKAVIMLTYSSGMRQGEVRDLKPSDIDSKRMVINVRNGKGGKSRQALLSPVTLGMLRTYWKTWRTHNPRRSEYLFMPTKERYNGKHSTKLSHTAVGYMVLRAGKLAGIKKKFTHIFFDTRLRLTF